MRNLPPAIIYVLRHFEPMFSERVWEWAKICWSVPFWRRVSGP